MKNRIVVALVVAGALVAGMLIGRKEAGGQEVSPDTVVMSAGGVRIEKALDLHPAQLLPAYLSCLAPQLDSMYLTRPDPYPSVWSGTAQGFNWLITEQTLREHKEVLESRAGLPVVLECTYTNIHTPRWPRLRWNGSAWVPA